MNSPRKLFGLWLLFPSLFLILAVGATSFIFARHFSSLAAESRLAYRQLIELQVLKTYQTMAEEAYLKLGSFALHEKALTESLGGKGDVTLTFFEEQAPNAGANAKGEIKPQWLVEDRATDSFTIPLFFDDHFTGTLEGIVHWKAEGRALLYRTLFLLAGAVGLWLLFSFWFQRKFLRPLFEDYLSSERTEAMVDLAKGLGPDFGQNLPRTTALLGDLVGADAGSGGPAETIEVETLIDGALGKIFSARQHSETILEFGFRHTRQLRADRARLSRALYHVATGTLDALQDQGRLIVDTQDRSLASLPGIEIRLTFSKTTNAESGRAEMGFAIARKMVIADGGRLSRTVSADGSQEFTFLLPADPAAKAESRLVLPSTGRQYLNRV